MRRTLGFQTAYTSLCKLLNSFEFHSIERAAARLSISDSSPRVTLHVLMKGPLVENYCFPQPGIRAHFLCFPSSRLLHLCAVPSLQLFFFCPGLLDFSELCVCLLQLSAGSQPTVKEQQQRPQRLLNCTVSCDCRIKI